MHFYLILSLFLRSFMFINALKEFFGFVERTREPEGYMSWQHILFVFILMTIMVASAVLLGHHYKNRSDKDKNKVLIWAAIAIDAFEIFKIIIVCARSNDPSLILLNLPLFLCSIQLITIPLAAFSRGRLKEAALDFVFIFGLLGAVLGTIGAGNIYGSNPVFSFDPIVSGITHSISGFATLYIGISGMKSMKKKNIIYTFAILLSFAVSAYIVNKLIDYNYMFLMRGDGTPYDILLNLVGGSPILYPICVVLMLVVYILVFYGIYFFIHERKHHVKHAAKHAHV